MKNQTYILFLLLSSICFGQGSDVLGQNKINQAKKLCEQFMLKEKIPGMSISISKNNSMIWSQGFGYSNIETKAPVLPNATQFRIASISKSLTAAGLAKLMDQKLLDLDTSIYKYLPDYPKKKFDFTVRQVGGHIAGIRHYRGSEFILNKKMSISKGLDIFKNDSLLYKPGSKYNYSTYGWNLISEVIQKVANQPFNEFMKQTIFQPLTMQHTTLDRSDSLMPQRTLFYIKTNAGQIVLGPDVSNEHKVAGGGFLSTSEDLLQFGREVIRPKLLSQSSVNELLKSQLLESGQATNYGVGFAVDKTKKNSSKFSHSGGGIGATTLLLMYPDEQLVIAILTNLSQATVRDLGSDLEALFLDQ